MNKSLLQNGMVVKSGGGRYGVVCLKDNTDENVIKFFYDPTLLVNHGFIEKDGFNGIVSLDEFDQDLTIRVYDEDTKEKLILWSIDEVYNLNMIWKRE